MCVCVCVCMCVCVCDPANPNDIFTTAKCLKCLDLENKAIFCQIFKGMTILWCPHSC